MILIFATLIVTAYSGEGDPCTKKCFYIEDNDATVAGTINQNGYCKENNRDECCIIDCPDGSKRFGYITNAYYDGTSACIWKINGITQLYQEDVCDIIPTDNIVVVNRARTPKYGYKASFHNIPDGMDIKWVKMKDANHLSWMTGVKGSLWYTWSADLPYAAPYSFKIKSKDGQVVKTNNVIKTDEWWIRGEMNGNFQSASAFKQASDASETEHISLDWLRGLIIVLIISGFIGICAIWMIKRRKKQKERTVKIDDITEDDGSKQTSYDMSPINTNDAETHNEEQNGLQEIDVEVEVNDDMDVN